MTDKEKKIFSIFAKVIPQLSDNEKDKLLAFGEGIAFKAEQIQKEKVS